jgi:hypothetical protein
MTAPQPQLSKSGRIIITSASSGEQSYRGGNDGDGVQSGEYFLDELFASLRRYSTIRDAFTEASGKTWAFTRKNYTAATNGAAPFVNAMQHPMMDDNGDGIGNILLSDDAAGDGSLSSGIRLGPTPRANSIGNPADLKTVTDTIYLASGDTALPVDQPLWAKPTTPSDVSSVWVELVRPDIDLTSPGNILYQLTRPLSDAAQVMYATNVRFAYPEPAKSGFTFGTSTSGAGRYEAYYYAIDKATGSPSPSKRSIIYKDHALNNAPYAPELVEPGVDGNIPDPQATYPLPDPPPRVSPAPVLLFQWQKSSGHGGATDPDGDSVTYRLEISTNQALFAQVPLPATCTLPDICIVRDEIIDTSYLAGPEVGLKADTQYYWRILAVDAYGKKTASTLRGFTPRNSNAAAVYVNGMVFDAGTSQPIRALLSISKYGFPSYPTRYAVADVDGSYYLPNLGTTGNYTLTADNSGYSQAVIPITISSLGAVTSFTQNVALSPGPTTHSVTVMFDVTGNGSGTVTSIPRDAQGGINCITGSPTHCIATFPVSQGVELTATRSSGSILGGWPIATCAVSGKTCTFSSMDSDKSVTVKFDTTPPFFLFSAGSYLSVPTLQAAYDAVSNNAVLQMQTTIPTGGLTVPPASGKSITIQGGYDANFTPNPAETSFTTIQGQLLIQSGALRVQRVKVR